LSILDVILGLAGDKGFAELFETDGIDGIEGDPGIGLQEKDEVGGRLFHADGDSLLWMLLTELGQPAVELFGGSAQHLFLGLCGAGVDVMKIGLAVGTIQADDQIEGMYCVHAFDELGLRLRLRLPTGLTRRRQYRRLIVFKTPS
jgi:hypothetical protein